MSMFSLKLKSRRKKKHMSLKECVELAILRRKFIDGGLFHLTPFCPLLVRSYLDSDAGRDLEEQIYHAIDQA